MFGRLGAFRQQALQKLGSDRLRGASPGGNLQVEACSLKLKTAACCPDQQSAEVEDAEEDVSFVRESVMIKSVCCLCENEL